MRHDFVSVRACAKLEVRGMSLGDGSDRDIDLEAAVDGEGSGRRGPAAASGDHGAKEDRPRLEERVEIRGDDSEVAFDGSGGQPDLDDFGVAVDAES